MGLSPGSTPGAPPIRKIRKGHIVPILNQTVHHSTGTHVKGVELPVTHKLFRDGPHLFTVEAPPEVEQASAAPGERRTSRRATPKKTTARK